MELYQVDYLDRYGDWKARWEPVPVPVPLHRVIRSALLNALAYTAGHQVKAAALLEISPRMMNHQMVTHQSPRDSPRVIARRPYRARLAVRSHV